MQESRRRRWLELGLLSLSAWLGACGAPRSPGPVQPASDANGSNSTSAAFESGREVTSAPNSASRTSQVGAAVAPALAAELDTTEASHTKPPGPAELPRGTLVLHVGDSFAGALGVALGKRLKAAGVRSALHFKTASYIPTWASSADLPRFVSNYNPDLVLVTLGANEFEIPDPSQRISAIRRLVDKLGQRPCIWISPPRWKADTGLLEVIRAHAAPCRFLDSDTLVHDLPRARDRIHPSEEGREIWANAVFEWLEKARNPAGEQPWTLRVDRPSSMAGAAPGAATLVGHASSATAEAAAR